MISTQWAIRQQTIKQQILGNHDDYDYTHCLEGKFYFPKHRVCPLTSQSPPKYKQQQLVSFQGGTGRIDSYHWESETWAYIVEMALGPEPSTGRVGGETTIVLDEDDILAVVNEYSPSSPAHELWSPAICEK